ncbi:hypothetical protein LOZ39_005752 [Ophidiomyces ophidiicola]|uniref:Uncharacterized protein n=1 Tax=Ophidiomyces ophidiicola TaxID=1387563 RepID=A0ACB8V209_9EURO|nr:uncharacterized protein LOZ57_003471 [Ophidiomyces ophidiicola]KAI1906096.1 hypothetical protein LOZ64_006436 [Ophidiomyces ophidiicola]KAI1917353.1 hypothetical protein LOZ61_000416 [Ophidiomyces ophidiicola]KAI1925991.1 hypothetical protein LOZ60_003803 [Ophidiomyces ophidiicola]KAI1946701.1 hypothetical protein LOZ57_003471 [Ophidiomyces ophidiicola]KAI1953335.1 hypothetical protein LOZ59_005176 [Ophidiomyces ophidiicola]
MAKLRHKVHKELLFEKKNRDLLKLPKYAHIKKRPINHPPAASPYAGPNVPKIVYVSSKTPFMSAAKRVQKLLREAEKRAISKVKIQNKKTDDKANFLLLKESTEVLKKDEVFIKATGRAIKKAMDVAKWLSEKEGCNIKTKTGTLLVVDDIVEDEELKRSELQTKDVDQIEEQDDRKTTGPIRDGQKRPKRKQVLRGETIASGEDMPESRTRWVNVVEIAVALR